MKPRVVSLSALLLIALLIAAACGTSETAGNGDGRVDPDDDRPTAVSASVEVAARISSSADPTIAGEAITTFGDALFADVRAASPGENVTISPASIAIALGMVEPGATGAAQEQLRQVLGIDDADAFHASTNALEQNLEAREPADYGEDSDPGQVTIRVANAAYLQEGYPFEAAYLDTIGSNYGPALQEVNYTVDPDAVAHLINDFVATETNDKITDLIGDGVITPDTVLALVNALYLNAPWLQPFDAAATADEPFTLLDGTEVTVPMMHGASSQSTRGDGWVGASKLYVGGLQVQFVLPDEGRFDAVAADLTAVFDAWNDNSTDGAELVLPRFETRSNIALKDHLQSLGITDVFAEGSLLGIADDPTLVIYEVAHETFVAMDEEGTEAAAATVVLFSATSGPETPPIPVVLDRPFLYRIIDTETGATLFIGQVTNPTS